MDNKNPKSYLSFVVMLGAVWGLSEAALGMGLRSCASFLSGSIMTGVALFFITISWVLTRKILGITLLIVIASLFKMFDALILSLPIQHGAIGNPIFAFLVEGVAFMVLIFIYNEKHKQKIGSQALFGGITALLAVNLFPLVKYATGVPACVFPGTGIPLSLYYTPFAVFFSCATVPLGFWAGAKIQVIEEKFETISQKRKLRYLFSPATLLLCLTIIIFIRLF